MARRNRDRARVASDGDIDAVFIDHDDISNYNPDQILPESPETIQKIRTWLQPTSYDIVGGEYRKHLACHVKGTGDWLTSSAKYQEWLKSEAFGLLWIRGIPGSGKSVMAANLVRELGQSNPGCPVLYFFFRQIIDANHEPKALLRDWLDQVLEYSPPLQQRLKVYLESNRSIDSFSLEDLLKNLRLAFSGLTGKVFCVADALDEMDQGHDAFLQALGSLGQWRPEKVKVLITSRPVPRVEIPLRKSPCLHIRLEENLVDIDISTYVQFALSKSTIPRSEWKVITDAVPGRANGLFLYAKLAMDAFLEPGANVGDVLSQLPADLNVLYTDLLKEHGRRSGVPPHIQHLILQTVTHAARPLRLLELAEMIKENTTDEFTKSLKATKDLIRAACGPLLEILADETVSVIHHSFTEYLKGTTRSDDGSGYPILRMGSTHAQLAIACLNYLRAGCLSTIEVTIPSDEDDSSSDHEAYSTYNYVKEQVPKELIQLRLNHPFCDYAISNWNYHVNQSEVVEHDQSGLNSGIREFLGNTSRMRAWLQMKWPGSDAAARQVTQLHIAAKVGLLSYTKELLGTMDVDLRDGVGRTPLWWAASQGHSMVVRELIMAGANPDQDDAISGLKPLHGAAGKNHHETVRLLLEAGVDPLTIKTREMPGRRCGNAARTVGHTALMYACRDGHVEAVEAFLPFLKNIDTAHRALAWAVEGGKLQVVAKILQHPGVDVNAKVRGDTPLFVACRCAEIPTIEMLLEAGADPCIICRDAQNEFGSTMSLRLGSSTGMNCLHRLCKLGLRIPLSRDNAQSDALRRIFTTFVQGGIDINQHSKSGKTILHEALWSPVLTRLLLDAGADANAADDDGSVPLHEAKTEDVIELLIEQGHANMELKDKYGRTPLLNRLLYRGQGTVLKLLQYRPNCNVVDDNGNGALHTALGQLNTSLEVLKALFEAGADPNLRNREGLTPLLYMRQQGRQSCHAVDLLLEAGADINATDYSGVTLLFHVIRTSSVGSGRDEKEDIQRLIDRGASLFARDFHGRTGIHEAVKFYDSNQPFNPNTKPKMTRFDFLLSLGLDIRAVDYHGNNVLHELALHRGNYDYFSGPNLVPFWEQLVSMGLDLEQRNHQGRTPLHLMCRSVSDSTFMRLSQFLPIDFVISQTKNLDVSDNDGITPLHIAAAQGQVCVKKLIDGGATPTVTTKQGLTPLHIAARCRESNVVALLLEYMRKAGQETSASTTEIPRLGPSYTLPWDDEKLIIEPIPGVNAVAENAKGENPITPLFCACRSGRPETVALLLEAGADVNFGRIFQACLGFEEEDEFWRTSPHAEDASELVLKLNDAWTTYSTPGRGGELYAKVGDQTTRLEEILEMLVRYGANTSDLDLSKWEYRTGDSLTVMKFDYTISCFQDARNRIKSATPEEESKTPKIFFEICSDPFRDLSISKLQDSGCIVPRKSNPGLLSQFLARREYHLVEEMARLGADFSPSLEARTDQSHLGTLVQGGFASLLDKTGTMAAESALTTGDWHAFGDDTRPGLWFAKKDLTKTGVDCYDPKPFLLMAVERDLPNMDVVRLLVEKFAVDINEVHYTKKPVDSKYHLVPSNTALHSVAKGNSWWHAHQALPYLLEAGVDTGIRVKGGQTPLHKALGAEGSWPGPFYEHAAKILIEAGADVNAINDKGETCLVCAKQNVDIIRLLKAHGAKVTAEAIVATIDVENFEGLEELLSGGIDPDICPERPSEDPASIPKNKRGNRLISTRLQPQENFPLYHAASKLSLQAYPNTKTRRQLDTAVKMVQILLSHGADPFATFLQEEDNPRRTFLAPKDGTANAASASVPKGYVQLTVLHALLLNGKVIDPFLDLPSLDVNHRDATGRTLLHAACDNHMGPDYTVGSYKKSSPANSGVTLFQRLLTLGADLEARDNFGRNVLHLMIGNHKDSHFDYRRDRFKRSLEETLQMAPQLANQADQNGETPLHCAIKRAAKNQNPTIAELLLSAGANPLAATHKQDTILHLLARNLGAPKARIFFQSLAQLGIDINARNSHGETPLFAFFERPQTEQPFSRFNRSESVEFVEEAAVPIFKSLGADFFAQDDKGRGLLHVAAGGDVPGFKFLMDMGLDVMLEDHSQQTAIDVAAACGNQEVLGLFEKRH